jgi:hypothetical protein
VTAAARLRASNYLGRICRSGAKPILLRALLDKPAVAHHFFSAELSSSASTLVPWAIWPAQQNRQSRQNRKKALLRNIRHAEIYIQAIRSAQKFAR